MKNLYPYGKLDTLHPNGLISYEDIPVRADGLSNRAACKARVHALEQKIEALKTQSKGKGKKHSKELKALMDAHDEALDELAMFALEEQDGGEVDDFDALMAGLDDVEEELSTAGPSKVTKGSGGEAEEEIGNGDDGEEWNGIIHDDEDGVSDDSDEDEGEEGSDDDSADEKMGDGSEKPSEPSSFSRIPTAHVHQLLDIPTTAALPPNFSTSEFPKLRKASAPYVVELSAGEMLYLPASWWHEVTSTSADDAKQGGDVHMAFNYWFYPPDALDNFEAPYEDSLVWSYLRTKGRHDASEAPAERVQVGKRARDKGDREGSKKARR